MKKEDFLIWILIEKAHLWLLAVIIFMLSWLFTGCSPAKQAARQNENLENLKSKFDLQKKQLAAEAVAEYLKSNPCTQSEVDLDSLCYLMYKDADENWQKVVEKLKNSYSDKTPDTVKVNDTLRIYYPQKKILVSVPDKRIENLLKDSLSALTIRLAECNAKAAGKKEAQSEIKHNRWALNNWWFWIALGLFLSWVVFIIIKIIK